MTRRYLRRLIGAEQMGRNSSVILIVFLVLALPRNACAAEQQLPLPGYPVAIDVQDARERPDTNLDYKVVFDLNGGIPRTDGLSEGLLTVARFVNTLAQSGVPAEHRHVVAVIHDWATPIVMNDVAFASRNEGRLNPNRDLIRSLKAAGVDLRVCGQAMLASDIASGEVLPEIQIDLSAITTFATLQLRGYAYLDGR